MIDFNKFLSWVEDRFGDAVVKGKEIKINSIFADNDVKHHLWCNPSGGKKDRHFGVYHCWKTDKKGTLVSLVMEVDKCTYEEALETLGTGSTYISEMEEKVEDFFNSLDLVPQPPPEIVVNLEESSLSLPPDTHLISSLPEGDYYRACAETHLIARKIPIQGLYVCRSGDFKERIVIPYLDRKGKLIYYNGRYFGSFKDAPKYLGPPKEIGISKEDVIYMPEWPEKGKKVYITEGEFDARSIHMSGLMSAALGGKAMSQKQIAFLRDLLPVIAFDNDKAGFRAVLVVCQFLRDKGFKVGYVRPPKGYKDWNKMLEELGPKLLAAYLEKNENEFSDWSLDELGYKNV